MCTVSLPTDEINISYGKEMLNAVNDKVIRHLVSNRKHMKLN